MEKNNLNSFASGNFDIIKNSDKNILFMGYPGVGKTSLINNLFWNDFEININNSLLNAKNKVSFARNIKQEDYIAIELPPFNSDVDKLKNYEIQKKILSSIPIKMLCFVIKFNRRFDSILHDIYFMEQILKEYKENTIIIISFSEDIINDLNSQKRIIQIIKEKYKYNKIIFSTLNMNNNYLQNKIREFMKETKNIEKIYIKDRQLISSIGNDLYDYKYFDIRKKYENTFDKILKIFKEKFDEYKNNGDIIRGLFFTLKQFKNKHVKKYYNELIEKNNINNEESISIRTEIITYNNFLYSIIKNFCGSILINIQLTPFYSNTFQDLYRFKKCPYCGIIWFKIDGNNCITCGRRAFIKELLYGENLKNYVIEYKDGKIIVSESEKNEIRKYIKTNLHYYKPAFSQKIIDGKLDMLLDEEKRRNEKLLKINRTLIQPIGCGNRFKWNEVEDITEEIKKFLGTRIEDYLTDFDAIISEIELENKIKLEILNLKPEYNDLKNKVQNKNYQNQDELNKFTNRINYIEKINKLYEDYINVENKDINIIKENSSIISNELTIEKNKLLDHLDYLIKNK